MKQYIIVALMLATVWGCSDDKTTNPDIVDKDTVEKTFVTIEGMINHVEIEEILDTLGDADKLDKLCHQDDEYDIVVAPSISSGEKLLYIPYDINVESTEVIISIETAKVSPELRDSIIARYGFFKEHEEFESSVRLIDTIDGGRWSIHQLGTFNYEPGAFILRVQRTGISDRCVPYINLGDDNEE